MIGLLKKTIHYILTGAAVYRGVYVSYHHNKTEATLSSITISSEISKKLNDTYSGKLIELESRSILVRIGAINILENLARAHPKEYYWPLIHVFNSYIKSNCNKYQSKVSAKTITCPIS